MDLIPSRLKSFRSSVRRGLWLVFGFVGFLWGVWEEIYVEICITQEVGIKRVVFGRSTKSGKY